MSLRKRTSSSGTKVPASATGRAAGRAKSSAARSGATTRTSPGPVPRKAGPKRAAATPARSPRRGIGPTPGGLRVVRARPAARRPAGPVSRSFPQARDGSNRQRLVFELVRARVAVNAAVQGLVPGSAEEQTAAGVTVRQVVLELIARDRAALRAVEAALRGIAPPGASRHPARREAWHAEALREVGPLDWDEALRRLHRERDQLMGAIESVPDAPAKVWGATHPFGALVRELAGNDRRCADVVKAWRTTRHN